MIPTARPADTTPEVWAAVGDGWRELSPIARLQLADRLSIDVADLALAGIRALHPEFCEVETLHELARRRYGRELADAAYRGSTPDR